MFSTDKNVNTIAHMLDNAKKYGELKLENFERGTVEKLTAVLTGVIMGAIILLILILVVIFLSAALVFAIAPHVGGYAFASLLVGILHLVILLAIWSHRQKWIATPINSVLGEVFLGEKATKPAPTDEDLRNLEDAIAADYSTLVAPPTPANNRLEQAVNAASRAWTIADGLILGYKLYRKFGGKFNRKRRR